MPRTTALLCLLLLACTAQAAALPDYPFVFVTGESEAHVAPDIVACSVTVRAFDADPSKAQKLVDRRVQDLLMFLSEHKVPNDDIEAYDIQKEIIANDSSEPGRVTIRGYNISRAVNFKLRDVSLWPEVSAMLLSTENMDDLRVNFDRTDRASIAADHQLAAGLHRLGSEGPRLHHSVKDRLVVEHRGKGRNRLGKLSLH